MDKELSGVRTVNNRYVVDDGWNVPQEVIEVIDLRIKQADDEAIRRVCELKERHKGEWITAEDAKRYHRKASLFLTFHDGQYVGGLRELGEELIAKSGITELEAINILNGNHINDYVNKYYRIKNLIPEGFDAQSICNETLMEYGYFFEVDEMAM